MNVLNRFFLKAIALGICLVLLSACGRSPTVKFYTLSSEPVTTVNTDLELNLAVGPADFPRYLDRKQIVTRVSPTQVNVDEYHVWGSSLESGFLESLGNNLSDRLASANITVYPSQAIANVDYQIVFDVMAFEGARGESVTLRTQWTIISAVSNEVVKAGIFESIQEVVDGKGSYDSLVMAHSATIADLSDALVAQLMEIGKPASE